MLIAFSCSCLKIRHSTKYDSLATVSNSPHVALRLGGNSGLNSPCYPQPPPAQQIAHWTRFDKFEADIMTALEKLNDLVDESDPDVDVPNIVHAFQTAERIRADYPDLDWFHLTGLIHDLGKVRKGH